MSTQNNDKDSESASELLDALYISSSLQKQPAKSKTQEATEAMNTSVPSKTVIAIAGLILVAIVLAPAAFIGYKVNQWLGEGYWSFVGSIFASLISASIVLGAITSSGKSKGA